MSCFFFHFIWQDFRLYKTKISYRKASQPTVHAQHPQFQPVGSSSEPGRVWRVPGNNGCIAISDQMQRVLMHFWLPAAPRNGLQSAGAAADDADEHRQRIFRMLKEMPHFLRPRRANSASLSPLQPGRSDLHCSEFSARPGEGTARGYHRCVVASTDVESMTIMM